MAFSWIHRFGLWRAVNFNLAEAGSDIIRGLTSANKKRDLPGRIIGIGNRTYFNIVNEEHKMRACHHHHERVLLSQATESRTSTGTVKNG